jgi:hypothetical protein
LRGGTASREGKASKGGTPRAFLLEWVGLERVLSGWARRGREKESVKGVRNPEGATNRVRQTRGSGFPVLVTLEGGETSGEGVVSPRREWRLVLDRLCRGGQA